MRRENAVRQTGSNDSRRTMTNGPLMVALVMEDESAIVWPVNFAILSR